MKQEILIRFHGNLKHVGVQDHVTILKEGFGFTKFIYVTNVKFEYDVGFLTKSS